MNNPEQLQIQTKDGVIYISSVGISRILKKSHKNVLRDIRSLNCTTKFKQLNYIPEVRVHRGKNYDAYFVTLEGLKFFIDSRRNNTKNISKLFEVYNAMCGGKVETVYFSSRFETSFVENLRQFLDEFDIRIECQKPAMEYKVDVYIPEYKLAVEYNEVQHKYTTEKDRKRISEIQDYLGCKFVCLDYMNNDIKNVSIIWKEIQNVRN